MKTNQTPKHILISHVYSSDNKGDAAILSAQISELKRVFPGSTISLSTIDKVSEGYTFDGEPVISALMYGAVMPGRGKFRKLIFALSMMSYTGLWALLKRRLHICLPLPKSWQHPLSVLSQADLQVCVGGGYLRARDDLTSTILLLLLVHQIWLARWLGKPVYLYAQSFGPYPTRLQALIGRSGIRAASLVLVREAKSYYQLEAFGVSQEKIVRVPDSAFLFKAPRNTALAQRIRPENTAEIVVGITVRSWLDEKRQAKYEAAIAALITYIVSKPQHRVVVVPQVTSTVQHDDDREAGSRIARLLKPDDRILFLQERYTHYDILSIYSSLDYLVGTRFHSVIFALLSGVPAVAIEYEHKTSGIMQDLGLSKWVIPIEEVDAKRVKYLFDAMVRQHDAYTERLSQVLPAYIAKARTAAELIAQDFAENDS
jgi:colanic acid/amylovoran biosynthesis protein